MFGSNLLFSETFEWNEERLPGAIWTGRGTLERDIESYVPDVFDDVVVYCASGKRSILAADALHKMGYKNVSSLQGGISAWKKAEYDLSNPEVTFSSIE